MEASIITTIQTQTSDEKNFCYEAMKIWVGFFAASWLDTTSLAALKSTCKDMHKMVEYPFDVEEFNIIRDYLACSHHRFRGDKRICNGCLPIITKVITKYGPQVTTTMAGGWKFNTQRLETKIQSEWVEKDIPKLLHYESCQKALEVFERTNWRAYVEGNITRREEKKNYRTCDYLGLTVYEKTLKCKRSEHRIYKAIQSQFIHLLKKIVKSWKVAEFDKWRFVIPYDIKLIYDHAVKYHADGKLELKTTKTRHTIKAIFEIRKSLLNKSKFSVKKL